LANLSVIAAHSPAGQWFNDAVSIRDRPAEVEGRAVPGHWEGDLIAGSGNSFIATLVELNTRYVMLAKVGNKDSHSVIQALIKQSHKLPKELYKSLTWDRGTEMAGHKKFTLATKIDVYLCEPQSPLSSLQAAIAGQCMAARFK
jgi:IS30 family transposase